MSVVTAWFYTRHLLPQRVGWYDYTWRLPLHEPKSPGRAWWNGDRWLQFNADGSKKAVRSSPMAAWRGSTYDMGTGDSNGVPKGGETITIRKPPSFLDAASRFSLDQAAVETIIKRSVSRSYPSEPRLEDEVWTCSDGRVLMVKDMHEDHVRNALRKILRAKRRIDQQRGLKPALAAAAVSAMSKSNEAYYGKGGHEYRR